MYIREQLTPKPPPPPPSTALTGGPEGVSGGLNKPKNPAAGADSLFDVYNGVRGSGLVEGPGEVIPAAEVALLVVTGGCEGCCSLPPPPPPPPVGSAEVEVSEVER